MSEFIYYSYILLICPLSFTQLDVQSKLNLRRSTAHHAPFFSTVFATTTTTTTDIIICPWCGGRRRRRGYHQSNTYVNQQRTNE